MADPRTVTALLDAMQRGETGAEAELAPMVYDELRVLAQALVARESPGATLCTTALVHEAYLKLIGSPEAEFPAREQFFGFAARIMRNVLVDYARQRRAAKRGGGSERLPLDDVVEAVPGTEVDVLDLDEALVKLVTGPMSRMFAGAAALVDSKMP